MSGTDEILRLCKLSHLEFKDDEIPKLVSDMENIKKFTDQVANYPFSDTFDNSYDRTHDCCRNDSHPVYEKCSHQQIMRGSVNKNGFFFVKHFSK